ncbi:unnamed protein product, partial [Phaeothamnion confervicola]
LNLGCPQGIARKVRKEGGHGVADDVKAGSRCFWKRQAEERRSCNRFILSELFDGCEPTLGHDIGAHPSPAFLRKKLLGDPHSIINSLDPNTLGRQFDHESPNSSLEHPITLAIDARQP